MTRHAVVRAVLCSFLASVAIPPGAARAEDAQAEGRSHFRRGVDFFKEGDYRAALIEFKRAYELAPNYKVLYNLGQTSLELQDYASALRSFERYLADGGKEIAAARRTQIEGEIDRLRKRVARVEVTTNVTDAEVFVDEVSVGRTPLAAPIMVSAGRRKFSASKSGVTTARTVDVAGGDTITVSLEIIEPTSALPVPAPAQRPADTARPTAKIGDSNRPPVTLTLPVPPPEPPPSNTGLYIGITATGVLAAATVATGIFAISAKKDFDNTVGRFGVDAQAVSDARSKTRTLAVVTDILGGATIVAGGITVVLAAGGGGSSKERARALQLDVTPTGLLASGRF